MSEATKALTKASKAKREQDKALNAWIKMIRKFDGREDQPEVQQAKADFKEKEAAYLETVRDWNSLAKC